MKFDVYVCKDGYVFYGPPRSGKSVLGRLVEGYLPVETISDLIGAVVHSDLEIRVVFTTTDIHNVLEAINILGGLVN